MFTLNPLVGALALAFGCAVAHAADTGLAATAAEPSAAPSPPGVTELAPVEIKTRRERLDAARSSLSPETGSTVYRFDKTDIGNLPLGDATPLNQVLLRAPGVVGDSYGQLHVRGDHANLQYRINGVVIPEAISGFGQALDTRFADQVNVLTGALPAQYGYRTAGVVDIRTKGADLDNSGSIDFSLGSRGHRESSLNIGGASGDLQYFVTGSTLRNRIGIENPTAESNALHDDTRQTKGFAYLSYLLGDDSRLSLMLGHATSRFQIPNVPGEAPKFMLAGAPAVASENLDANQHERNNFQVLTFQSSLNADADYQVSVFRRTTDVRYQPDPVGDLSFTGVAADVLRRNTATGVQADFSMKLGAQHTVRGGLFVQRERGGVDNTSLVFPADGDGNQTSSSPLQITDNASVGGHLYGVYLQDEWRPVPALTVNYGLRYDKVATVVTESQVSPRLGATYQLGDNTRVHAGYARYFTPPPTETIDTTSVQKFLGTTNALPSDANTAVQSERSHYFDLGVSHQLTPQITLGADAYYRQVRHLQDEGQFGNALIYSAFNFAKGRIFGVELSASYKDPRLTAYANLGLSSARGKGIETGQFNFDPTALDYIQSHWVHLDHEQRLVASAGASYQLAGGTVIGGDVLYGSGMRNGFANSEHLPGYTQVNASAMHGFTLGRFGKLEARLSVINLLDRSYQLRDGSGIGVGAPQYAARRSIYLGLSQRFTF